MNNNNRTRKSFIYWLAERTYLKSFKRKFKVSLKNDTALDLKQGPMLVMSNHCGTHDPMAVSSVLPCFIRWVCGAYLMKTVFLRFVFKHLSKCIGKQQGQGDLSAIRNMQKALRKGDVVGLFPEGTRTWDGEMMPVATKPLAKMIKIFKVPAVFINLEGGYASEPRWADEKRMGNGITVHVRAALMPEQSGSMDVDEIEEYIKENFFFSNDLWKKTANYSYKAENRASGIQRVLYLCPQCKCVGTIVTDGNIIRCGKCGLATSLNEKDNLQPCVGKLKTVADWHKWEASYLSQVENFSSENGVLFQKGKIGENKLSTLSKNISVSLSKNTARVYYKEKGSKKHLVNFPYEKVSSLILNAKQTIELCMEDEVYRIRLLPDASSLKYHEKYLSVQK